MKKYIFLIFILLQTISYAERIQGRSRVNFGIDINGSFVDEGESTINAAHGFVLDLERVYRANENFEYSLGLSYQGNGTIDTEFGTISSFYSIPAYVGVKYNIFGEAWYIKTKLGIPLLHDEESIKDYLNEKNQGNYQKAKYRHGYYFSLGVGLDYGDWEMEVSYNVLDFTYRTDIDQNLKMENIRIAIGLSKFINED